MTSQLHLGIDHDERMPVGALITAAAELVTWGPDGVVSEPVAGKVSWSWLNGTVLESSANPLVFPAPSADGHLVATVVLDGMEQRAGHPIQVATP